MQTEEYIDLVSNFQGVKILVIGDVMLDRYILGTSDRISEEAGVPIIREDGIKNILGGAANVAANIVRLGGRASLCGVIGKDYSGQAILDLGRDMGADFSGIVVDDSRPTTTKERIMSQHRQVLRVDHESKEAVSGTVEKELTRLIQVKDPDLIIFSDYAKGVITPQLVESVSKYFNNIPIIADFKPTHADRYVGKVKVILPNLKEAHGLTGTEASTPELAEKVLLELAKRFENSVVLKRSEHGMSIYSSERKEISHIPTRARQVFDVTGAGDTVIAVLGLALAVHAPLFDSAKLSNIAAGIVVEKQGTAHVVPKELINRIIEESHARS